MIAYLACAIDHASDNQRQELNGLQVQLSDLGFCVYTPKDAWCCPKAAEPLAAQGLCQINEFALNQASLVVAVVSDTMHSVGVPAEIASALAAGKEVVLLDLTPTGTVRASYVLAGWVARLRTFRTVLALVDHLREVS